MYFLRKNVSWTGKIEKRREELDSIGIGPTRSAQILSKEFETNITKDMVAGRKKILKKKNGQSNQEITKNIEKQIMQQEQLTFFTEEDVNESKKYIRIEKVKKELSDVYEKYNDGKKKKILSLSDIHVPYANIKAIDKAIKDNLDADLVIISGDLLDNEAMSTYDNITEWDLSEEFNQVRKILKVLNDNFSEILVIEGNHEGRFSRYITRNIKPSLREYAIERLNPLKYITEKYENIHLVNYNTVQIGSCIFKHPNKYNSPELRTVVNEKDILKANEDVLPNNFFNMVMIGHTHQAGEYFYNHIKLIEQGCLCLTPDYRVNEPIKRIWTTGYGIVYLDENGIADLNKSKFVCLD